MALIAGLAGCAGGPGGAGKDVKTASDQTNNDRLAKLKLELASAYFARGQNNDALDEIKQSIAVKPDSAQAYGVRGLIYAAMGNPQIADESFRRALELAPHDGDLMHNYGWFLCGQQRYADAQASFERAVAEPTYRGQPRTWLAEGVCLARENKLDEAEKFLSRAYDADPGNPNPAVNLAEVLYRRGQYERALFYVRRVNAKEDVATARTLWLAAQIEHKLGKEDQVQALGSRMRDRFPTAPETALFDKGRFE